MTDETQTKKLGLLLIDENERLTFSPFPGCEFYYRRAGDDLKEQYAQKFIKDERTRELDGSAYLWALLEFGLLGWSGVYFAADKPAPFSLESARCLETWLLMELRDRIAATKNNSEDARLPLRV